MRTSDCRPGSDREQDEQRRFDFLPIHQVILLIIHPAMIIDDTD